jgi:hypothetical protein
MDLNLHPYWQIPYAKSCQFTNDFSLDQARNCIMESTNEIISTKNHIFGIASLTKQKGLNALTCPTIEFFKS